MEPFYSLLFPSISLKTIWTQSRYILPWWNFLNFYYKTASLTQALLMSLPAIRTLADMTQRHFLDYIVTGKFGSQGSNREEEASKRRTWRATPRWKKPLEKNLFPWCFGEILEKPFKIEFEFQKNWSFILQTYILTNFIRFNSKQSQPAFVQ